MTEIIIERRNIDTATEDHAIKYRKTLSRKFTNCHCGVCKCVCLLEVLTTVGGCGPHLSGFGGKELVWI